MSNDEPKRDDDVEQTQEFVPTFGDTSETSEFVPSAPLASQPDSTEDNSGNDATLQISGDGNSPPAPAKIGTFGDYSLDQEIARGGMGVVYRATQTTLNRPVALKMILAGQLASDDDVRRFYAEAESAAKLDHPNIVPIYEVGQHEETHYFSMKLIEGSDLGRKLPDLRGQLRTLIEILEKVCLAVAHAHQRGVLHRDLKPANILLDDRDEPFVTDLGLARGVGTESNITRTGAIVGTPSYMSPEQASGDADLTIASDIYSLGAILYEVLSGQPPFRGRTPMETLMQVINDEPSRPSLNANTDRSLETIALKCLEKSPNKRYASARELADDLRRWLNGEPIAIRAPSFSAVTKNWVRQNFGNAPWILVVGTLGGLISGFGLWNATIQRDKASTLDWVYNRLPSQDPPFSLFTWTTPEWLVMPSILLFVFALALLGYFTALLVQTKNTSADIAAGLAVGIIAGTGAFFFALATMTISVTADSTDINLLGLLADAPLDQTPLMLTDHYPEIEHMDRNTQIAVLKQKIISDRVWTITRGLVLATAACFSLFVLAGIAETMVAGRALRREQGWLKALGEYAFRSFPYLALSIFIGVHVAVTLIFGRPGIVFDKITVVIVLFMAIAVFVELKNFSLWTRVPAVIAAILALLMFLFQDFQVLPSLARERMNIAETTRKAERFPDNERLLLEAASSFQSAGVTLYNGRRYSYALSFFEQGINYLDTLPAERISYALQSLIGSAQSNRATALHALGRPDEGIQSILQAAQRYRDNPALQEDAIAILFQRGHEQRAEELLEDYLIESPADLRVFTVMARSKVFFGPLADKSLEDKQTAVSEILEEKVRSLPQGLQGRLQGTLSLQQWRMVVPVDRSETEDLQGQLFANRSINTDTRTITVPVFTGQCAVLAPTQVSLGSYFPDAGNHTAAFAIGKFNLLKAQRATIAFGSDDGFAFWLNGELIDQYDKSRMYVEREDVFEVQLRSGENEILLRINQNQGPWGFGLQVDGDDGWPLKLEWLKPEN